MYKYKVEGGHPLKGSVRIQGNKNAALPCLAATLLSDEPIVLENLPALRDVEVMLGILEKMGSVVERLSPNSYRIQTTDIRPEMLQESDSGKVRASVLFVGPLLARLGSVKLPLPGGDVIGKRRLDTHFLAMKALGASGSVNGFLHFQANKLVGSNIFLDEASVTATENAIMAAALAEGETVIENAASEPHVQDLCLMINAMGGEITGIGSNILRIRGKKSLHGAEFKISPDFMEISSFIGLAAVTQSELELIGVQHSHLRMVAMAFRKMGIHWTGGGEGPNGDRLIVPAQQAMKVYYDVDGSIPKIDDSPWPGFPADLTSIMTVVATQVEGTILIHEKMFESRLFFVDKLINMGARIILCDPHRAVVTGATRLSGQKLLSPDVRAGMAMLIAALCARGTSVIHNIYQIERGYEDIAQRLCAIGAKIERLPEYS
ncbi:UDP-N-acetylglucosamine 1-carboxyvinyltransferase [Candidatus Haliotispira prima]|uniref:UDP-N-acetylglucosamine 1-carboxyvinyltransferase n=1 Tax=Candidatus Haliotispira prima TaxID=3034016 RepID=A0ABY8MMS0_9SPIO|nr:UDP-N-acetylglucosamine 1-carboxyvinyltransferase [Candidatus Haliotispira prima]